MKRITFILLLLLSYFGVKNTACAQVSKKSNSAQDCKDTIIIDREENDKIAKCDLINVLKECPEFKETGLSPDEAYARQHGNKHFDCEVCRDDYYQLYAYFLKQKNGDKANRIERKKLITLYRDINLIYGKASNGGNFYGHQDCRILGYAEYSIYQGKDNDYYNVTYSISKQKTLYLNTLRQMIRDMVDTNDDILPKEKPEYKKQLFKTVNEIGGLITNIFYLKMAQWYQYSNY